MSIFRSESVAGFRELMPRIERAIVCGIGALLVSLSVGRATLATEACNGDCNGDEQVTVDEITVIVNIVLGNLPISSCPIFSQPPDVTDIVLAVNAALMGCPQPTPTPSATATPFPTLTPVVFQVADGSRIFYSDGDGAAPIEEALAGTFAFRLVGTEPQFFIFDVVDVNLSSAQFDIVAETPGQSGRVRMGFACDSLALMNMRVLINEEALPLIGSAEVATCPPDVVDIRPFEVCTTADPCEAIQTGNRCGYSLSIIAVVAESD
jgi:hypothetical protein